MGAAGNTIGGHQLHLASSHESTLGENREGGSKGVVQKHSCTAQGGWESWKLTEYSHVQVVQFGADEWVREGEELNQRLQHI